MVTATRNLVSPHKSHLGLQQVEPPVEAVHEIIHLGLGQDVLWVEDRAGGLQ